MNKIRQRSRRLHEGDIRKWLIRSRHDAMVRSAGVGDDLDVALRHMAADAVVRRLLLHSNLQRKLAASARMAGQAFAVEIRRSLFA